MTTGRLSFCFGIATGVAVWLAAGSAPALHAWDDGEPAADAKAVSFSARGSYGILEGEAHEYVYGSEWFVGTYTASELIWDLKDVSMAGAVVSARFPIGLSVNAGVWMAVSEGSGQMNDYDWQIPGADWTDWSLSDVSVIEATVLDVNASFRLFRLGPLACRGVIGYKQDAWEWEDSILQYVYSVNGFRDYVETGDGGNAIDYRQVFRIPYAGLHADAAFGVVAVNGYVLYSPWVSAKDEDYHLLRNLKFDARFSGGSFLGIGGAADVKVGRHGYLGAALDVQVIPEFQGDMTIMDPGTGESVEFPDSAGVSHASAMLSVVAGVRF